MSFYFVTNSISFTFCLVHLNFGNAFRISPCFRLTLLFALYVTTVFFRMKDTFSNLKPWQPKWTFSYDCNPSYHGIMFEQKPENVKVEWSCWNTNLWCFRQITNVTLIDDWRSHLWNPLAEMSLCSTHTQILSHAALCWTCRSTAWPFDQFWVSWLVESPNKRRMSVTWEL